MKSSRGLLDGHIREAGPHALFVGGNELMSSSAAPSYRCITMAASGDSQVVFVSCAGSRSLGSAVLEHLEIAVKTTCWPRRRLIPVVRP
jgi:hypothetical protein